MGTVYQIGCHTCGIYRSLDKFMSGAQNTPKSRADAITYTNEEILNHSFRYTLLVSFLLDHASHNCEFFSSLSEEDRFYRLKKEPVDFWKPEENEKPLL